MDKKSSCAATIPMRCPEIVNDSIQILSFVKYSSQFNFMKCRSEKFPCG